jgi:hypothetical protein
VPPGNKKWVINPAPTDRLVNQDALRNSLDNGWIMASHTFSGTSFTAQKYSLAYFQVCTP